MIISNLINTYNKLVLFLLYSLKLKPIKFRNIKVFESSFTDFLLINFTILLESVKHYIQRLKNNIQDYNFRRDRCI